MALSFLVLPPIADYIKKEYYLSVMGVTVRGLSPVLQFLVRLENKGVNSVNETRILAALLTIAFYSGTNNSNPKPDDVKTQYGKFIDLLKEEKGIPKATAL